MVQLLDGDLTVEWYDAAIAVRTVGMDIETSGLNRETDRIATVQMFVPTQGTVMVRNFDKPRLLIKLLEDRYTTKIFHHAPFDLSFLVRDYSIWPENIADTKVAAKVLDPKRKKFIHPDTGKGSHSLLSLVYYYFGDLLDKSLAVSNWFESELSPAQLLYAAKDVEYLPELLRRIELEISQQGLQKYCREAMNALPSYVMLELKNINDIYGY